MIRKPKYLLQIKQNYSLETENCALDRTFCFISYQKIGSYCAINLLHIAQKFASDRQLFSDHTKNLIRTAGQNMFKHFPSDSVLRFIRTENLLHIAKVYFKNLIPEADS